MKRLIFSSLSLLLVLLFCSSCNNDAPKSSQPMAETTGPPNILVINCEDISPMLPMFGDSTARTPNLSRLAARGIRYPNTFSVAGVCAPSRHSLITGMYPISTGAHHMRTVWSKEILAKIGLEPYGALLPPEVKVVSQIFRENGYFTSNNKKTDYQFHPPKTAWDESGPKAHWRHRTRPDQPFYAVFDLEITHESQIWTTHRSKLRFQNGFEEAVETTFKRSDVLPPGERPPLTIPADADLHIPPYLIDSEPTRTDIRRVYSNIEIMDQQVGVLIKQLEDDGLLNNTIIFFFSDHGGPLPRQKRLMYDSGLRVPHIVAFPDNRQAGSIDSSLVSFVDMAPTMLNLAGIPLPSHLQGQAFLGPELPSARKYVFAAVDRTDEHYDRIRAARDRRFKYLRNYMPQQSYYLPLEFREQMASMQELLKARDAGTLNDAQAQWFRKSKPAEELFDTQADPHELNNLAGNPQYATKLAELRSAMDNWLNEVGDLGAEDEREMVSRFWNGQPEMPTTGRPQLKRDSMGRFVLESKTEGAQIAYQITPPGQRPGKWQVYTGPFEYQRGDSLRAVAHRIGYKESGESIGW
ncbi:sulfatase family protein [Neolewinella aurantiaca]|nr:sulfatase [Neolewinella aurantiaca]